MTGCRVQRVAIINYSVFSVEPSEKAKSIQSPVGPWVPSLWLLLSLSLCLLWLKALLFLVPSDSVWGLARLSPGACSFPIPGPMPPSFLYPDSPLSLTSLKSAPASAHLSLSHFSHSQVPTVTYHCRICLPTLVSACHQNRAWFLPRAQQTPWASEQTKERTVPEYL